jgi:hypothetical protein
MKKLDDIPKREAFEAPEGYFDSLPGIIQARVAKPESVSQRFSWKPALLYAMPMLVVAIGLIWYLNAGRVDSSPEQLLAAIETADIEAYLDESGMTTEDLLDHIDYNQIDADSLVFENPALDFSDADIDELLNDFETEL